MKRRLLLSLVVVVVILVQSTGTWAGGPPQFYYPSQFSNIPAGENPQYHAWASFKPGSWVKGKGRLFGFTEAPPEEFTVELVSVTADSVEVSMSMLGSTTKMEYERKLSGSQSKSLAGGLADIHAMTDITETEDPIRISGKLVKSYKVEVKGKAGSRAAGYAFSVSWMSKEVPGYNVKVLAPDNVVMWEVVDFQAKK